MATGTRPSVHLVVRDGDRVVGDARRAAWAYEDAWTGVDRISGLISFEPDKVEAHLDGTRLHLEPGQSVIPHGPDRDLTTDELAPGRQA